MKTHALLCRAAIVTFIGLLSASGATRYVNVTSTNPAPPFHGQPCHLEIALELQKTGPERARLLVLKAMNLRALARHKDAHAAFDEAEAIMKPRLLDDLPEREAFLNHDERTYLIFHREAKAALDGDQ